MGLARVCGWRDNLLRNDHHDILDTLRRYLRGTGCHVDSTRIRRSEGRRYDVTVDCLSHALKDDTVDVVITPAGSSGQWCVIGPRDFPREQRARRQRHDPASDDRGMTVDALFAARLRGVPDKAVARRLLFALSQCQEYRMTTLADVSHTAIRDGLILATLALGNDVTWRMGEIRIKGRSLPQSILLSMPGHRVAEVVDLPAVRDRVIRSVRSGAEGIVIRCENAMERYGRVWRDLGGE